MLRSMQELENYTIGATDGEIGHVTDLFFDDDMWTIRYLVVETGSWLLSRKVLISPFSLMEADWQHKRLPVRISRDQVRDSPDIDTQSQCHASRKSSTPTTTTTPTTGAAPACGVMACTSPWQYPMHPE